MSRKSTQEEFISKAILKHGDRFDYSLVEYFHSKTKVKIICNKHGMFKQEPRTHLRSVGGCPECAGTKKLTIEKFIEKAKLIHGNKYDYSLVEYKNNAINVELICNEHGVFEQSPNSHLSGIGCPECAGVKKLTTEMFIEKAKLVHENKYDYSKTNYINAKTKVIIVCPTHGEFQQEPRQHLYGQGCPICGESRGEKLIRLLLSENNINFIPQHKFYDCKNILSLPFDFYLPKLNTCIEFNGKQHYKPINWFGGEKGFKTQKMRDKIKENYCNENNIPLIIIRYDESVENILKINNIII